MRLILGLSLVEFAERIRKSVHWVAGIEGRRSPSADLDELVLHTMLMKSGVRWHLDLIAIASLAWHDREIHDWDQLLDHTTSADLADLDEMAGPRVEVDQDGADVLVTGRHAQVHMLFPLDIEEFWDVVEDVARTTGAAT